MTIQASSLTFTYTGADAQTLRGLDFTVEPGEIFGFLGPSGAGKSTTQKILIGLLRGYQGRVTVLGRTPQAWGAEFYERIGVSFEFPNHYLKLTGAENLATFAALYRGPTRSPAELLEAVALGEEADRRVGQYSKGMKARLSVARSLLHNPELLFWDEPTAGLDPVNARRIKDLALAQKAAGKTIFLTTHDMTLADDLCDRVAFIVDGSFALLDAPREVRLKHGRRIVRVEWMGAAGVERREFPLDTLGQDAAFIEVLRNGGVRSIHTLEATLEDVFLQVTGRDLTGDDS